MQRWAALEISLQGKQTAFPNRNPVQRFEFFFFFLTCSLVTVRKILRKIIKRIHCVTICWWIQAVVLLDTVVSCAPLQKVLWMEIFTALQWKHLSVMHHYAKAQGAVEPITLLRKACLAWLWHLPKWSSQCKSQSVPYTAINYIPNSRYDLSERRVQPRAATCY